MHDYLADGLATVPSELVHTELRVAILDDIIGLGVVRFRTVQYISAPFPAIAADLETVMGFTARLRRRSDVAIDADTGEAVLTESGFRSAEKKFGREALFQAESPAFLGRIHTALRSSKKVPEPKDTSMMLARIDLVDYLRQYQRVVGAAAELRPHRRDLKVLFGIEPPAGPEAAARQTSGRIDHRDLAFQEVEAGRRVRAWEHRRPILFGSDDNWRLGPELGATGPEAPRTRAAYQRREQELGPEILRELERRVRLSMQDFAWRRFLEELDMCMLYLGYLPPVRAVLDGYFERYRLFAAERFEAAERSALAESRRYILTVDVAMKT